MLITLEVECLNKLKQKDYFIAVEFYIQENILIFQLSFCLFLSLIVEPFSRIVFSLARFELEIVKLLALILLFHRALKGKAIEIRC